MLVLSRRRGERIVVDNDIFIEILEVQGDKVRIGIDAPRNMPIHREEVWLTIQKEKNGTDKE